MAKHEENRQNMRLYRKIQVSLCRLSCWKPQMERKVGRHTLRLKRFCTLWFWLCKNLAVHQSVKNKATGTPFGMYYIHLFSFRHLLCLLVGKEIIYLHRRGAFSVARFDRLGNARAFTRWNEWQNGSTLFRFCIPNNWYQQPNLGAIGCNKG